MFEVEEEEIVSMPAAKKSKPEAVRSAPPKKAQNEIKVDPLKLDEKKQSSKDKDDPQNVKKEKTDSYSDDDWGDNAIELEDKADKIDTVKKDDQNNLQPKNEIQNLNDDFFNVEEDPILNNKQADP